MNMGSSKTQSLFIILQVLPDQKFGKGLQIAASSTAASMESLMEKHEQQSTDMTAPNSAPESIVDDAWLAAYLARVLAEGSGAANDDQDSLAEAKDLGDDITYEELLNSIIDHSASNKRTGS